MSVHTVHVRNAPERHHARSSRAVDRPAIEPPAGRNARLPAAGSTRTATPDHACTRPAGAKGTGLALPYQFNDDGYFQQAGARNHARHCTARHGRARPCRARCRARTCARPCRRARTGPRGGNATGRSGESNSRCKPTTTGRRSRGRRGRAPAVFGNR
jgi:hypothetical protein